jgi:Mce-associated membrane protein
VAADAGTARGELDDAVVKQSGRIGRAAVMLVVGVVVCTSAMAAWLGWCVHQTRGAEHQRSLFIEAARQCALSITTLDWQHADADVQRILDSSSGTFHDDLVKRRAPFTDMVKSTQSSSAGTVTEAGVESESDAEAQVVVIASIRSSNKGVEDQGPRIWRLHMTVKKVGDNAKVSNVEFVQ